MSKKYILFDYFSQQNFYVTQGYGVNADYYSKFNLLYHEGVDFGNKNKKVILKSPIQGIVVTDQDDGRGAYGDNIVIWDDQQLCAIQVCHLDKNFVSHGQRIKVGQDLGEMGSTGNSTGEHIHFNFMVTDKNGNRLYRVKTANWGYLDPQHPLDTNLPKFPTGVEKYTVEWKKVTSIQDPMPNPTPATTTPTEVESLLRKYMVKDIAELQSMIDREFEFLDKEREKTGRLETELGAYKTRSEESKKELNDFILEIVNLFPLEGIPGVTDKALAINLVKKQIDDYDKLRHEIKTKEKEFEIREQALLTENEELKRSVLEMGEQIKKMQIQIERLGGQIKQHGDNIVEVKKDKSFLDIIKKILFR